LDAIDYSYITESTRAIIFLGTPHRGSDSVRWPILLSNIANVAFAAAAPLTGQFRKDLLKSLERNSEDLKTISTNFRNQISGIKIVSCIEQDSTPPFSKRARILLCHINLILTFSQIVDDDTGTLDVPGEIIVPMSGCDHQGVCRFPKAASNNYRMILGHIKSLSDGQ
jgi:protein SERAC1